MKLGIEHMPKPEQKRFGSAILFRRLSEYATSRDSDRQNGHGADVHSGQDRRYERNEPTNPGIFDIDQRGIAEFIRDHGLYRRAIPLRLLRCLQIERRQSSQEEPADLRSRSCISTSGALSQYPRILKTWAGSGVFGPVRPNASSTPPMAEVPLRCIPKTRTARRVVDPDPWLSAIDARPSWTMRPRDISSMVCRSRQKMQTIVPLPKARERSAGHLRYRHSVCASRSARSSLDHRSRCSFNFRTRCSKERSG